MSAAAKPLPAEDLDHVLAHTRELWTEARGQTFFVTGGTGFFGQWLLESFTHANDALALGMRAVVLTRDPAAFAHKAPHLAARADVRLHLGDLRTFAFPAGHFDGLIHAAADTDVWTKNKEASRGEVIAFVKAGTTRILDFAEQAGVKNFLLVSSGAVYGPQPPECPPVSEDSSGVPDPQAPGSAWGEGKCVAEQLCLAHARRLGLALKIARGFVFVGPLQPLDGHYALGNFIGDALRGDPIEVRGDGTPIRSYLYAADLAIWLWTIFFRGPTGRAYNVGSDEALSIAELADAVNRALQKNCPVIIRQIAAPGRPGSRYVPAIRRAETELGLRVRVSLDEAIQKTAAWHGTANG